MEFLCSVSVVFCRVVVIRKQCLLWRWQRYSGPPTRRTKELPSSSTRSFPLQPPGASNPLTRPFFYERTEIDECSSISSTPKSPYLLFPLFPQDLYGGTGSARRSSSNPRKRSSYGREKARFCCTRFFFLLGLSNLFDFLVRPRSSQLASTKESYSGIP